MRYQASKDLAPARNITFNRCWHGKLMALPKRTIRHRIESATCTHTMCPYRSRSCRQRCGHRVSAWLDQGCRAHCRAH